jgi:uncharacterized protein (TIGR02266 family)
VTPTHNRYSEQRRASRVRVSFPARYVSANLSLEGHVTDLSAEGLFFSSDYLDDQGEPAQLIVQVPQRKQPLALRGEVRWVKDAPDAAGMGIRLVGVSVEDQAVLQSLLSTGQGLGAPIRGQA